MKSCNKLVTLNFLWCYQWRHKKGSKIYLNITFFFDGLLTLLSLNIENIPQNTVSPGETMLRILIMLCCACLGVCVLCTVSWNYTVLHNKQIHDSYYSRHNFWEGQEKLCIIVPAIHYTSQILCSSDWVSKHTFVEVEI